MKIYLAPMEGITTYVYRNSFSRYFGGIDKYFTPFLTASHLKGRELREVHPDNNQGINVVPQILTNDSELFLTISKQLADLGYREVNLNLGCPSGTVVSKGRGSGFLAYPEKLDRFLDEIYSKTDMKISIKTRIGMDSLNEWEDILQVYIKYPMSELIIHPRLREELYNGTPHMDAFHMAEDYFRNSATTLCYNGDITKPEDIKTDKDIMIGRGIIADPTLAAMIHNENTSEGSGSNELNSIYRSNLKPYLNDILEGYLKEMSYEKQAVMKMKELWTFMSQGKTIDKKLMKDLYKTKTVSEYKAAATPLIQTLTKR